MLGKIIAPVIITAVLGIFLLGYATLCFLMPMPVVIKFIGMAMFLALFGVSVFVLIQRIQEIRSGEEDDLSKY